MTKREYKTIENRVERNLWALQGRRTDQEMAYIIGNKSRSTWCDRMENPLNIKLGELIKLSEKMKIPLREILFGTIERR